MNLIARIQEALRFLSASIFVRSPFFPGRDNLKRRSAPLRYLDQMSASALPLVILRDDQRCTLAL